MAEAELESELPSDLKEFYLYCDGLAFQRGLKIPGLREAMEYFSDVSGMLNSTMLVVGDEDDSNPICIFSMGPLRGFVAHVFHDGDSHVRWRSFASFLKHVAEQFLRDGETDAAELPGDLDGPIREERDAAAGCAMIAFARELEPHSADSCLAFTFAFDLLGECEVRDIARFLDDEDMFVARSARERLAHLSGAEAAALLRDYWAKVKALMQRCVDTLRRHGRNAEMVRELDVRIQPENVALNWEAIYTQKARADFDEWLLGIGRRQ